MTERAYSRTSNVKGNRTNLTGLSGFQRLDVDKVQLLTKRTVLNKSNTFSSSGGQESSNKESSKSNLSEYLKKITQKVYSEERLEI